MYISRDLDEAIFLIENICKSLKENYNIRDTDIITVFNLPTKQDLEKAIFFNITEIITFYIILAERILVFEYSILLNTLELKLKIKNIDIKFICTTSNYKYLLIFYEVKSKLKFFEIFKKDGLDVLNFGFILCKLIFEEYSTVYLIYIPLKEFYYLQTPFNLTFG